MYQHNTTLLLHTSVYLCGFLETEWVYSHQIHK